MPLDADAVRRGCRGAAVTTARQLCRAELERFAAAAAQAGPLAVGCTQEAPLFAETAKEGGDGADGADISFVNLRETAGWSTQAAGAGPKMAALIAAAGEPVPDVHFVSLSSDGVILIYGRDEGAIEAATLLKEHLDVTVLLTRPVGNCAPSGQRISGREGNHPPADGLSRRLRHHRRRFCGCPPRPRATALSFAPGARRRKSRCDIVLDISGASAVICRARPSRRLFARRSRRPGGGAARGAEARASSSAPSTNRATSLSRADFARIRARRSSAAAAASIFARPAPFHRPAITSRSTPRFARAAASVPPPARRGPPLCAAAVRYAHAQAARAC